MPKQGGSGIHGIPWHRCDRCGLDHPVNKLRRQKGLILCVCHGCLDNLDVESRDEVIREILSESDTQPFSGEMGTPDILVVNDDFDPEQQP